MMPKRGDLMGSGVEIHSGSFGGGTYQPRSNKTLEKIWEAYSVEEILDMVDVEDIELYLRKKKLEKITKKMK